MTVAVSNTNLTDSFNSWRLNTNLAATVISNNAVTVFRAGSSARGKAVTGNTHVKGTVSALELRTTTIKGGNAGMGTTGVTGNINIASNTSVTSTSLTVAANTTFTGNVIFNTVGTDRVNLGDISRVIVSGGTIGQFLRIAGPASDNPQFKSLTLRDITDLSSNSAHIVLSGANSTFSAGGDSPHLILAGGGNSGADRFHVYAGTDTSAGDDDLIIQLTDNVGDSNLNINNAANTNMATISSRGLISANGAAFVGNVTHVDSVKSYWGTGNDLQIHHNGTHSYIDNTLDTSQLYLQANTFSVRSSSNAKKYITANTNVVTLYYNDSAKIATKTDGVLVTGELQSDTLDINGNADISGTTLLNGDVTLGDATADTITVKGNFANQHTEGTATFTKIGVKTATFSAGVDLEVARSMKIGENIQVVGNSVFDTNVTVTGTLNVPGGISGVGATASYEDLTITGNTVLGNASSDDIQLLGTVSTQLTTTADISLTSPAKIKLSTGNTIIGANGKLHANNAITNSTIKGVMLENSGVTAATYGSASAFPVVTVDAQGLVTGVTTSAINNATASVKGIASFSTDNFLVSSGVVTVKNNGIILGTETTGNYIATVAGTSNQITVSGSGSETAGVTLSLPSSVTISGTSTAATFIGALTGNVTGNVTGTAATVTTAAQPAITSLGTLSALTTGGLTVTGTSAFSSSSTHADNVSSYWGTSNDLRIVHDGSNSYINDTGTGSLIVNSNQFLVRDAATNKSQILSGTAVTLYYDNAARLATSSGGVTITGTAVATGLDINGAADISGTLTVGNVTVTGTLAGAIEADTVIAAADNTDTQGFIAFFNNATGAQAMKTDTGLTYNASTNSLTTGTFQGALTGNVTGNVTGTAATVTTAAQPAITSVGTLSSLAVTGNITAGTIAGNGASITTINASNITTGTIAAARVATLNQTTTGNATTATRLQTARTIGGVSFNGTAAINLPGVNTSGNQNTSGNATTATNLTAGSKTIAGNLTVGNTTNSSIVMVDTDEGNRSIHCNSQRVGFLNQAGGWSAYSIDSGQWQCDSGLYVTGAITATGNITAYSDRRLKTNIELIPNSIDKIKKINGYTFNRTDMEGKHTGVIAQEVEKVLPEVVVEDEDGMKSVAYGNMVGLLIEAIKDQQKQIDNLTILCDELKKDYKDT